MGSDGSRLAHTQTQSTWADDIQRQTGNRLYTMRRAHHQLEISLPWMNIGSLKITVCWTGWWWMTHTNPHANITLPAVKIPYDKEKNIHRRATSTRPETLSCVGRNGPELGDSLAELRLILTAEWGKTRKSSSWARDGPDDENSTFEPGVTSATAQSKRAFHCLDVTFAFGRFTTQ